MSPLTLLAAAALLTAVLAGGSTSELKKPEADLLFPAGLDGKIAEKRCLNFGSPDKAVGPFLSEDGYIQWVRTPSRTLVRANRVVAGTDYSSAFNHQRHEKNIVFLVHVDPAYRYDVSFAFAEIYGYRCHDGRRVMRLEAMSESIDGVDVHKTVGCNAAHWEKLVDVRPYPNGNIRIKLSGTTGFAALAGICFEPTGARNSPSPSPVAMMPSPSPTMTPSPTPSSTPSPTPSPSPKPLTAPSTCQQSGCMNLRGRADYVVIGNSLSRDEDREDCGLKSSASANLAIPTGARVVSAVMYWSASGRKPSAPSARLNGMTVSAHKGYSHAEPYGSSHIYFYGAEADVTSAVRAKGSGSYSVSSISATVSGAVCTANAAYAAWTMVVVYERSDLPVAQVNVCTNNFLFTFPQGTYSSRVGCLGEGERAKTTVVTFESDDYKGEYFYINGVSKGDNIFRGATAPNLDIHEFDVSQLARNNVGTLTYSFVTYVTNSVWGRAVEGLFFPVRVTHTEL